MLSTTEKEEKEEKGASEWIYDKEKGEEREKKPSQPASFAPA